jgi:hypothetical protein
MSLYRCVLPMPNFEFMKKLIPLLFLFSSACGGKEKSYAKATDALDAGREYIGACMEGDFKKAAFYMVDDAKNKEKLDGIEKSYREKDKEGRQNLRTASITINEVKNLPDSSTEIKYNNSFDKQPHTVTVINKSGNWLVDLGKK